MSELYEKLRAYSEDGAYPFHMPGHKRNRKFSLGEPVDIDITEIDGFDDLRHPDGVLAQMQSDAARVCGSRACRFLVNGSSGGMLSAVWAAAAQGSAVLMSRACHVSVYNAVVVRGLEPFYLRGSFSPDIGAVLPPTSEEVRAELEAHPEIKTVIITSPTYEGVIADVAGIAQAAHEAGAILIVDEAHGAHLNFHAGADGSTTRSAVTHGADVVVQSLHKTLPALTQTAVLHVCSDRVDVEAVDAALRIFQTSSPSYVFMSSMANALEWSDAHRNEFCEFEQKIAGLREELGKLKRIGVFSVEKGQTEVDIDKIVLFDKAGQVSGPELYDRFGSEFGLQPEMSTDRYVLMMTTVADTDEGLARLIDACRKIDEELSAIRADESNADTMGVMETVIPERVLIPAAASGRHAKNVDIDHCEGEISAELVYCYPPGVPLLVPGEKISEELRNVLVKWNSLTDMKIPGYSVRGLKDGKVSVIDG